MSFFQFWIGHVSIDLCRRDRCMAEEFLYDTDICTIRQECRGEAMTEGMCVHILEYPSLEAILLYHIRDKKSTQSDSVTREIDSIYIFFTKIMAYK